MSSPPPHKKHPTPPCNARPRWSLPQRRPAMPGMGPGRRGRGRRVCVGVSPKSRSRNAAPERNSLGRKPRTALTPVPSCTRNQSFPYPRMAAPRALHPGAPPRPPTPTRIAAVPGGTRVEPPPPRGPRVGSERGRRQRGKGRQGLRGRSAVRGEPAQPGHRHGLPVPVPGRGEAVLPLPLPFPARPPGLLSGVLAEGLRGEEGAPASRRLCPESESSPSFDVRYGGEASRVHFPAGCISSVLLKARAYTNTRMHAGMHT